MGWQSKRKKFNKNKARVQAKFKAKNKGRKTGQGGTDGFSKAGLLTFAGLRNFFGIGNPESNQAHRLKVGLRNNLDYSDMQEGPTIKINPKQWLGGFEKKTNIPTGWIRKNIPKWASGNWVNHTLKSPKKIMPTDPRYNFGNRKGEQKFDKDTAEYLKWIARVNPQGNTVSDYKKLYKRQLDEGIDLKTAMKYNPAETGSFYALIDDSTPENNLKISESTGQPSADTVGPTQGALTKAQQLENIYQSQLGRSADAAGAKYWLDTHAQGDNVDWNNISRMIGASDEGKKFAAKNQLKITT